MPTKRERIQTNLDAPTAAALRALAVKYDRTLSKLIAIAIKQFIEREGVKTEDQ